MGDNSTIELQTNFEEPEVNASGKWDGGFKRSILWSNLPAFYLAGLLLLPFSVSETTSVLSSRVVEQIQSEATRSVFSFQRRIGRQVSRSDALRIVKNILVQAEQERLEVAEFEAERGLQWDEEL
jgi:hypothetical protein